MDFLFPPVKKEQGNAPEKHMTPIATHAPVHPVSFSSQPINKGPMMDAAARAEFMSEKALAYMSMSVSADISSATAERSAPSGLRKKMMVDPARESNKQRITMSCTESVFTNNIRVREGVVSK